MKTTVLRPNRSTRQCFETDKEWHQQRNAFMAVVLAEFARQGIKPDVAAKRANEYAKAAMFEIES